jgi:hypothetical protein
MAESGQNSRKIIVERVCWRVRGRSVGRFDAAQDGI